MEYTWIFFAILSAITAALVAIFSKIGLEKIDANTATAIRAVIMAAFLLIFILIQNKMGNITEILKDSKALTFIFLGGISGALSWLFYFMALKIGKASHVAAIDRLSIVFVIIFATLFLGENLSIKTAAGAVLISAGAILIAIG